MKIIEIKTRVARLPDLITEWIPSLEKLIAEVPEDHREEARLEIDWDDGEVYVIYEREETEADKEIRAKDAKRMIARHQEIIENVKRRNSDLPL